MPEFQPFRGITYDPSRVALTDVLCPSYDRITTPLHQQLLDRSPYNAVQLMLGANNAAYRASGEHISSWLRDGILLRDDEPAFYILSQSYRDPVGTIQRRFGIVGMCRLEDFSSGTILPHLKTIPRIREDRFRQIQMMNANIAQVLGVCDHQLDLFGDIVRQSAALTPHVEIETDNVIVRMWRAADPKFIASVRDKLQGVPLTIAEGHHGYEAALAYRDMMQLGHPGTGHDEPFNYVMMCIEDASTAGGTILPVHRLVNPSKPVDWDLAALQLAKYFKLKPVDSVEQMHLAFAKRKAHTFGMLRNSGMWLCSLVDPGGLDEIIDDTVPAGVRSIDATILHALVLEKILRIDVHDQVRLDCVNYAYSVDEVVENVLQERAEVAFLLPPVRMEEVRATVRSGALLPPRATNFHPQWPSGLIMRRLDERVV